MNKPLGNIFAALAAVALLQGCVQFSDTINRPQVSTLPADGSDMALQNEITGSTYPAAQVSTAQSSKYHPNVAAYFQRSCESSYKFAMEEDPSRGLNLNDCRYSEQDIDQFKDLIVYQDKDVAVITAPAFFDEYGNSGSVPFELLDLHAPPGNDELFWCEGRDVKTSRKGSRITMKFNYDGAKTEVFDLKKKGKQSKECKALRG